jgi:hypothetical protein
LTGLEIWEDLRRPIRVVLKGRGRPNWLPRLWQSWQRYPDVAEIAVTLSDIATEHGWERVSGPAYASVTPSWVEALDPSVAIVNWLGEKGLSHSDVPSLAEWPLRADAPLSRGVRDAVMTHGSRDQLQREGVPKLLAWFDELSPENRMAFHANYLEKIPGISWELKLSEAIKGTYGLPRTPTRPAFWDRVSEPVRDAFQAFFIEKKLAEFFAGDTERHQYWRRWMGRMTDVRSGMVGRVEYAILEFGAFGVVEFFETGNAAYFYRLIDLRKLEKGRATNPADLKQKLRDPFERRTDNRILHMSHWDVRADQKMQAWMRGTRR